MKHLWVCAAAIGLSACVTACQETQIAPPVAIEAMDGITVTTVIDGLSAPWSVAEISAGDYLIAERGGALKRVTNGQVKLISGVPETLYVEDQAGLFDVMLGEDFDTVGTVVLSYAAGTNAANGTAVSVGRLDGDTIVGLQSIFQADPPKSGGSHFGGRLSVVPGALLLSTGEGFEFRKAAQDLNSDLGKIIKVAPGKAQNISYGHRNVQGLAFDTASGILWAHEHGPRGGDELNIIEPGKNYGWPMVSLGLDYNGAKITPLTSMDGVQDPVYSWTPSIAPSGLAVYRGDMFAEWNGDLLIGGLASKDLRRLDVDGKTVTGETRLLGDYNARVRDVRVAGDGAILVLLDDPDNGKLLRISR